MTAIVGGFPSTITNGTAEDATQVMALFAFIQSQVNNNACPKTAGSAVLKGDGSGATTAAVAGTDYLAPAPGMLFDYAGASIPSGYLACDGAAVSRTTYSDLFAAIGTTWGAGNGTSTFNVPDLRRRTTIGAGGVAINGPTSALGAVGGEEAHVLNIAELAAHNHTINVTDPTHNHSVTNGLHSHGIGAGNVLRGLNGSVGGGANFAAASALSTLDVSITDTAASNVSLAAASTGITATSVNTGSGLGHNNMQPSAVVNKIIKT